jgi:hypothetical protein
MIRYVSWAGLLLLQSAANTFVSRARNSGSYGLHAIAAVASNGVWMIQQFVALDVLLAVIRGGSVSQGAAVVGFYTACTVVGSLSMHYVQRTYIETGNRRVGA